MQTENAVEIAKVNDEFRRSGFGIVVTPGAQVLENLHLLLDEIRRFNAFTDGNDPYGTQREFNPFLKLPSGKVK